MESNQPEFHRRAFLAAAGRAGKALSAVSLARASPGALAAGTLLPTQTYGQTADHLVQPKEIRSQKGVLDATLTAAPGMVQLGGLIFPGFLYNGSLLPKENV